LNENKKQFLRKDIKNKTDYIHPVQDKKF